MLSQHQAGAKGRKGVVGTVIRSWVFWAAAVVALVASPALFLALLIGGSVVATVGVVAFRRHGVVLWAALGLGLAVGSLPYSILALLRLMELR